MPSKKHDRQYDLVVFGATGYTGKLTAEHITTHLPTDLKWAVAGRSRDKLEQVVAKCKTLTSDRLQPEIEVCNLNDDELAALAKKTRLIITTVGPYGGYGEHAFKACAENGTHYLDVTGEAAFVARMIKKYESAAKASGAVMIPEIGIESAPADLLTWSVASTLRSKLSAPTGDVVVSIHNINSAPSGGTLATVLSIFDNFSFKELVAITKPFALSPVPNPNPRTPPKSLLTKATGLATYPEIGLQTTSIAQRADAAIVGRTWGLLQQLRGRSPPGFVDYGPNFSFTEHAKPRNWLMGVVTHVALILFGVAIALPPARALIRRFVYQPGEGATAEETAKDEVEYRAIADPDVKGPVTERAFGRAWYKGGIYYLTGVLLGQAASTILEGEVGLEGGIYTPACLGQPFINRLDDAGFRFETKMIPV